MDYSIKIKAKSAETGEVEYWEETADEESLYELLDRLNRFEIEFFTVRLSPEVRRQHRSDRRHSDFDDNMLGFLV